MQERRRYRRLMRYHRRRRYFDAKMPLLKRHAVATLARADAFAALALAPSIGVIGAERDADFISRHFRAPTRQASTLR